MAERPDFQRRQFAFAAHIRDPEHVAVPAGIDDRRMTVYRELFANNLRNLLATMFPVLRKLHADDRWYYMVREFMRVHRAQTPYFLQLPREFLHFLAHEFAAEDSYPFLAELAHYEYAELEVSIEPEPGPDEPDPDSTWRRGPVNAGGDLLDGIPVLSPASRVYRYRWPVHRISPAFIPAQAPAEPVCLAIYRDRNDKVRFLELNPLTAQLLECLRDNPAHESGRDVLQRLADDAGYRDSGEFLAHGTGILAEMRDIGLIVGSCRSEHGVPERNRSRGDIHAKPE